MKQLQQTGMTAVWILTIGMSLLAICYTMIIPFLPVYLLELGVDQEELAIWSGLSFLSPFSSPPSWRLYGDDWQIDMVKK